MGVLRLNGKAYGGGIDVIEVTQAQYNALPESKLSDDILYVISDSVNGSDGYPPMIYSDEEREVGVWRDGKPLYQKTVHVGALVQNSSWHNVPHGVANLDKCINIEAICIATNGTEFYPISLYRPTTNSGVMVYATASDIYYMNNYYSEMDDTYVTIWYTKTTDTAGSGTWTPSGANAVHYSTNEQVVGTWIDGKPLYEKSFNLPSAITINNASWTNTGVSIPNIKNVVDGELNRNGLQKFACSLRAENSAIVIQTYFNGAQCNTDSVVTVRYTKTTD